MITEKDSPEKRRLLGWHLKSLREQAGLTQQEFAEIAGCSKNYISAIERGINKLTVSVLLEYCDITHTSPNEALRYGPIDTNRELVQVVSSLTKTQYDMVLKMIKALADDNNI